MLEQSLAWPVPDREGLSAVALWPHRMPVYRHLSPSYK